MTFPANSTAIVTGGTKGIGLAISTELVTSGVNVVVCSRNEKNVAEAVAALEKAAKEATTHGKRAGKVHGLKAHVAKSEDRERTIDAAYSAFGRLDYVVSNVAVSPGVGPLLDVPESAWEKIFDVNVKASFLLARDSIKRMLAEGNGGHNKGVLFIASIAGYTPLPTIGAYSISKTALFGVTKALSSEVAHTGLRVNCLAPGIIKTDFSTMLWEDDGMFTSTIKDTVHMKRFGTADEMARTARFLLSNDASYITGETICATGGMTARL